MLCLRKNCFKNYPAGFLLERKDEVILFLRKYIFMQHLCKSSMVLLGTKVGMEAAAPNTHIIKMSK